MKRYISLLLILPVLIMAVAAPVSAAEANYGVYNLLDYGQIVGSNAVDAVSDELGNSVVWGNTVLAEDFADYGFLAVWWHNPGIFNISGWSALVIIENILDLYTLDGDFVISETDYGDNVYFLSYTGPVEVNDNYVTLTFMYDVVPPSGSCTIEFLNLYVKADYDNTIRVPLEIYDVLHGTTDGAPAEGSSYDYLVNMNDDATNQSGLTSAGQCCLRLRPMATEGTYDYLDLNFEVTGINITSISCLQGDKALEFDVGYSYLDTGGNFIVSSDSSNGEVLSNTYTRYWVSIRVYTEGANFIQGWPVVFINGTNFTSVSDGQGWNIKFYPTYVSYNVSILDPYVMWLNKIYQALHPEGAEDAASEFQNQVDQKAEQMQEMAGVMDSVEKPAMDSVSSDMSGIVSQGDIMLAAAPLNTLMSNEIILSLFTMALVFVTAAYVLYGKRG